MELIHKALGSVTSTEKEYNTKWMFPSLPLSVTLLQWFWWRLSVVGQEFKKQKTFLHRELKNKWKSLSLPICNWWTNIGKGITHGRFISPNIFQYLKAVRSKDRVRSLVTGTIGANLFKHCLCRYIFSWVIQITSVPKGQTKEWKSLNLCYQRVGSQNKWRKSHLGLVP